MFAQLERIAVEAYDRLVGLMRDDIAVDGCLDLTDTIITVRSLTRRAWILHRRDSRPNRRR